MSSVSSHNSPTTEGKTSNDTYTNKPILGGGSIILCSFLFCFGLDFLFCFWLDFLFCFGLDINLNIINRLIFFSLYLFWLLFLGMPLGGVEQAWSGDYPVLGEVLIEAFLIGFFERLNIVKFMNKNPILPRATFFLCLFTKEGRFFIYTWSMNKKSIIIEIKNNRSFST